MAVGEQHFSEGEPQDSPLQDQDQRMLVGDFDHILRYVRLHRYRHLIVQIDEEGENTHDPLTSFTARWKMPPPLTES